MKARSTHKDTPAETAVPSELPVEQGIGDLSGATTSPLRTGDVECESAGRYFGSKEHVLGLAMAENLRQTLEALAPEAVAGSNPYEVLTDFGRRLVALQTSPTSIWLFRVVVGQSAEWPDLADVFFEHGPGCVIQRLGEVLEIWRSRGDLALHDSHTAALQFVGMIRGNEYLRVVLGLREAPAEAEIDSVVAAAVDMLMGSARVPPRAGDRV